MIEYKLVLGTIAAFISIFSYIPYIINCAKGKTKPHIFTWFVWTVMSIIAFFAQITSGAGAGAWTNGAAALMCLLIAIVAYKYGEKNITTFDKITFALAIIAIILWAITKNALLAVILVVIADALAYIIMFVKAYKKPHEETITTFVFSAIKHTLSLFALTTYSWTTVLFPAYLVIFNPAFVITVFLRRRYLAKQARTK